MLASSGMNTDTAKHLCMGLTVPQALYTTLHQLQPCNADDTHALCCALCLLLDPCLHPLNAYLLTHCCMYVSVLAANHPAPLTSSQLADSSPLKRELVEGVDILIVRELVGGIYFGQPRVRASSKGHRLWECCHLVSMMSQPWLRC